MKNIYWIKTTTVLKIIFNRFQGHYRRLVAGLLIILLLSGSSIFVATPSLGSQAETEEVLSASAEKNMERKTISPVPIDKSSERIVVGTVISNETAGIYARREGIVKDVLVDIGDTVKEGQIIARLLPPGVEGEGAAMIAEKRAMVNRKETDLRSAEAVSKAAIQTAEQELEEKNILLKSAEKNKNAVVQQAETIVDTTTQNEADKINSAEQEVEAAKAQVTQMVEQASVSVIAARKTVEEVLFGDGSGGGGVNYFSPDAVPRNIGLFSTGTVGEAVSDLNRLVTAEEDFLTSSFDQKKGKILEMITKANALLTKTRVVLKNSTPGTDQNQGDILTLVDKVVVAMENLLQMKEGFEDAENDLIAAEKNVNVMKSEQRKMVDVSEKDFQAVKTMRGSEIENLYAQLKVSKKKVELMRAEQQKMVEGERAELQISKASLQQEYARSGNQEIRSPFSGVVSKRLIRVGEAVDPGMPAFELVNVPTTLAKKAKREIQFGLPEDLNETLKIGDTVEFFLPTDENTLAQAIVTRKSPQIDPESRIFTIQAKVDDHLIIPHNTRVRVRIATNKEEKVYRIPSGVIKREEGDNSIWILSDDENAKSLSITVRNEDGEFAEVTGDMSENTKILLQAPPSSDQLAPTTL